MPQIIQAGALNTTALTVPDLYVQIIPPQYLLNGVPTNIAGLVGTASWGPVNQPAIIGGPSQYAQLFGPVMARSYDMGTYVAIGALQGAANYRCVRVTDGTDTAATASIGTSPVNITFTSLWTGSYGNNTTVTLTQTGGTGLWQCVIQIPGLPANIYSGISGSGAAFWTNLANAINNGNGPLSPASTLIKATAGTGTTAPTAGTTTLASGTDGVTTITSDILVGSDTASPRTGMYALRKQGCSVAALCDCTDATQWTTQISFGLAEGIYMVTTTAAGSAITNGTTGTVDYRNSEGANSYALKIMHGDWLYWNDTTNGVIRLTSPQAWMVGLMSNMTPNRTTLNKQLLGIIGSQKSGLSGSLSTTYAQADLQELFTNGIDVITNPIPRGAMWGARGGFNSTSNPVISDDSYTRMTNYIGTTLGAGMGIYVGEDITPNFFNNVTATLSSFMATLVNNGLLSNTYGVPYSVVCSAANNPQSQTDLGYVTANVQVRYNGINKYFVVNLDGGASVVIVTDVTPGTSRPATPVQ
jgi:phage tail sheath protein FI